MFFSSIWLELAQDWLWWLEMDRELVIAHSDSPREHNHTTICFLLYENVRIYWIGDVMKKRFIRVHYSNGKEVLSRNPCRTDHWLLICCHWHKWMQYRQLCIQLISAKLTHKTASGPTLQNMENDRWNGCDVMQCRRRSARLSDDFECCPLWEIIPYSGCILICFLGHRIKNK